MKRLLLLLLLTTTAHAQTTLQIVNARSAELFPIPGGTEQDKVSFQGNAVPDYTTRVAAIQITRIYPWTTPPTRGGFFKTEVLPLCPLESDGSVKCSIPCNIDYQLRGVDAAGNVVAEDNTLHRAVCGEKVTCHGCHDGHSAERIQALGKSAVERFKTTIAGSRP